MLHQITWSQYLLFVSIGLLIYYSAVWLIYFDKENGDASAGEQTGKTNAQSSAEAEDNGLIGQPADEYGVSTLDSDELNFGPNADEDEEELRPASGETDNDELVQGDIADLLEDIKPAFDLIEENDPENKERLIGLIVSQIKRYPRILQSELLEPVLQEICDNTLSELGLEIGPENLKSAIDH